MSFGGSTNGASFIKQIGNYVFEFTITESEIADENDEFPLVYSFAALGYPYEAYGYTGGFNTIEPNNYPNQTYPPVPSGGN